MVSSINMGWWVLSKYYQQSDEAPVYVVVLLLHPSRRKRYININWEAEWQEPAIEAARSLWVNYRDLPIASSSLGSYNTQGRQQTTYDLLAKSLDVIEAIPDEDEFKRFIHT